MDALTPALFALLAGTFVVAGLVKGVSGMGLPTVAMALLGTSMPPATAAALLVVPSLVTNVWQLAAGPDAAGLVRRLSGLLLGIVIGTVAGTALLTGVDTVWTTTALGVALLLYAGHGLIATPRTHPVRSERRWSPVIGATTGLVTGATGVFVLPVVPYLQALQLDRERLVQALGLSFTVSTLALAAGLGVHGAFRVEHMGLSALALVPALAGMWLGSRLRRRLPPALFRVCVLVLLLLLGLELASRPLR